MRRHKDIDSLLALLVALALSGNPETVAVGTPQVSTPTSTHAELEKPTRRCEILNVPEAGRYWLVSHSQRPSTAPSLLVLGLEGNDPQALGRSEMTLLDFAEPGEHAVCRTSDFTAEPTEWTLEWAGDPLEIEEVIDPVRAPGEPEKAGDEYEIEEVIDP